MNAAFFSPRARGGSSVEHPEHVPLRRSPARYVHRWVATLFTLTVIANFIGMALGKPPTWITYAPLPPLLVLLTTGLVMLVRPWPIFRRAGRVEARPGIR